MLKCSLAVVVLMALTCLAARGADLPKFQFAYGQPAIAYADAEGGSLPQLPLAVDASHIYVGARDVWVFDRSGAWQASWPIPSAARGSAEPVLPYWPTYAADIGVGSDGLIYVLDASHGLVHRFDMAGRFIGTRGGVGEGPGQFPKGFAPQHLAAAPDGSLSFLSGNEIRRYRWDGQFLNGWTVPPPDKPDFGQARAVAAAPDSSLWVLRQDDRAWGDVVGPVRSRLLHYSPEGKEITAWDVPGDGIDLAIDPHGNVWTLHLEAFRARLEKRAPEGRLLLQVPVEVRRVAGFAISRDGHVFLATEQPVPKPNIYELSALAYSIEERDLEGKLLHSFGDFRDLRARGAILQATSFAATPQGDVYIRTPDLSPGQNFVSHYDPAGRMVQVIDTDRWPTYNPATQKIEFRARSYQAVDVHGNGYTVQLREPEYNAAVRRYAVSLSMYSPDDQPIAWTPVLDFLAAEREFLSGPAQLAYAPDGWLRLALVRIPHASSAPTDTPEQGTLEVYTLTTDGKIVSLWTDPTWGASWLTGLTVDTAGRTYAARQGAVRLYLGAGRFLGAIGEEGTASPLQTPSAMHVDTQGRLRVLDASPGSGFDLPALNHVLVFGGK